MSSTTPTQTHRARGIATGSHLKTVKYAYRDFVILGTAYGDPRNATMRRQWAIEGVSSGFKGGLAGAKALIDSIHAHRATHGTHPLKWEVAS